MLNVESLNAGYRELHVLFDVDFKAVDREITAIVGPNGSGKSTLLKAIFGIATILSGKIFLDENDITEISAHKKARMGMAYLPQLENIFTNLTVEENLKIAGYTLNESSYREGLKLAFEVFPELKEFKKRCAGTLSGGERQFLAISTALVRKTRLIMLDEPTAQLSPKLAEAMFHRIVSLKEELGLSIILVEQDIKNALKISDSAYVLASGRVTFHGKAHELLKRDDFERLCIGVC